MKSKNPINAVAMTVRFEKNENGNSGFGARSFS